LQRKHRVKPEFAAVSMNHHVMLFLAAQSNMVDYKTILIASTR